MADAATLAATAAVIGSVGTAVSGIIYAIAQFRDVSDNHRHAERLRRKADRLDDRRHPGDDDDDEPRPPIPMYSLRWGVT